MGIRCADHVTSLYPQKLALTSPISGGRSVGIVRSRTKATEFSLVTVTSNAVKRRNGKQTGRRRLARSASLRPQLALWLGLAWPPDTGCTFYSPFTKRVDYIVAIVVHGHHTRTVGVSPPKFITHYLSFLILVRPKNILNPQLCSNSTFIWECSLGRQCRWIHQSRCAGLQKTAHTSPNTTERNWMNRIFSSWPIIEPALRTDSNRKSSQTVWWLSMTWPKFKEYINSKCSPDSQLKIISELNRVFDIRIRTTHISDGVTNLFVDILDKCTSKRKEKDLYE